MRWSIPMGRVFGIPVYMHATFLLLLAWLGILHWMRTHSVSGTLEGIVFILAVFACVLLHEFGHALTARRFGIKTKDVTLLPIGGLARLEKMPEQPMQELLVALAGPAVNVAIAGLILGWLVVGGLLVPLEMLEFAGGPFLMRLLVVNVILVVFNLVPAFPMDGGRVLRALLATRLEYTRATQIAATVGQSLAFAFGFIGLFFNPFLIFIALFVWIGAAQESNMVQMKSALGGIPVARAMQTRFRTLSPQSPLAAAVALTLSGSQKDFPVVQEGQVVGVLLQKDLVAALTGQGPDQPVYEVMQRDFEVVEPGEMLETVFERLQGKACTTVPVAHRGHLMGVVTMDNIGEFLAIQGALKKRGTAA